MKTKLLLLLTLTLFIFKTNAQCTGNVNIPNTDFKSALLNNHTIDLDNNNEISCTEASNYTGSINVSNLSIDDLTGIEAFINITSLTLNRNYLEDLDVSKNTALTSLSFSDNYLTSIDLSSNTALTFLSCGNNKLTSLDVSNNTLLETLYAGSNEDLTSLDVSSNTALTKLYVLGNEDLTQLNIANGNNTNFDTSVSDFTDTPNLICIKVDDTTFANNNWSSLKDTTATYSEDCATTAIPDVNFEQALIDLGLDIGTPNGSVLTEKIRGETSLSLYNKNISDLTGIEDFIALTNLTLNYNNLSSLDLSKNTVLTNLSVNDNNLTSLNITKNITLEYLSFSRNNLTSLDLSKNTYLETIYAQSNNLTSLDLSKNTVLLSLYCSSNNLTKLDIRNTSVFYFNTSDNPDLTCISVDDVTNIGYNWVKDETASYSEDCYPTTAIPDTNFEQALIDLEYDDVIDGAVLTANISGVTSLLVRNKSISDLTGIEDFIALETLYVDRNNLTSLDVSNNTALDYLVCYENNLTSLDLSNNAALTQLNCNSNNLTSLDVSANTNLSELYCNANNLTILNIANGNNSNFYQDTDGYFASFTNNPNLTCIKVDDATFANNNWSTLKDATATYSEDCATTAIPDTNFEQALIDLGLDAGTPNGSVLTANISGVTSLDVSYKNISDLTGIEDFVSLTELYVTYNNLSSLNITNNTALTNLQSFGNKLESLDVTQNTALTELRTSNNLIEDIDLTNNTELIKLSIKDNILENIDVSQNTKLTELYISGNNLSTLNVTQNTALTKLACYDNELESLDVTQNIALTWLSCFKNKLESIDISQNIDLFSLAIYQNKLETLDATQNIALTELYLEENNLTSLNLKNGNNNILSYVYTTNNPNLTCIQVDNTSNIGTEWEKDAIASYSEDCTTALTYVPDDNFEQALIDQGFDDVLDDYVPTDNISGITKLLLFNKGISDLTGIEDFTALTELSCTSNNNLTSIDLSKNTALIELRIYRNNLTNINLTKNTALTTLTAYQNNLSTIDLSNNTALTDLNLINNNLSSLDLSENTELTELHIRENNLTSLDLSKNIDLIEIDASENNLTSIDLTNSTALIDVDVSENNLASLNITNSTALTTLYAYENNLSSIDLTKNIALDYLNIRENNLSSIDLTKNIVLTDLNLSSNNLTSLDLSNNTALVSLDISSNNLTSLDISNNTNLNDYDFDVTDNPSLTCIQVDNLANVSTYWNKDATANYSEDCNASIAQTYVPDDNFEQALIDLGYDDVLDDYVPTDNINNITTLDIRNKNISNLTGIEDFIALTELDIAMNNLTNIDITKNTALTEFVCFQNNIASLDLSKNTALVELSVDRNNLTNLDVTENTALTYLDISENALSSIDITKNTALIRLNCSDNNLTSLDITKNTALTNLNANNNQLETINLSNNTSLQYLDLIGNALTNIDVTQNTALQGLKLSTNDNLMSKNTTSNKLTNTTNILTELDVTKNILLTDLYVDGNNLISLDVSKNTVLNVLYCANNNLTSLNIKNGNNSNLFSLNATGNSSLTCIQVDNVASIGFNWSKDATASYSEDCNASIAQTYVPDDNFEQALIDLGYDDILDDYVPTDNINNITTLDIRNKNISNLTGIEDFIALTELDADDNNLISLDITNNTALIFLSISFNNLTSLNVTNNTALTELLCLHNNLTTIDLTLNTALTSLICNNNKLTSLDLTENSALTNLFCPNNNLISLNIKNGNNANQYGFNATGNPDLTCIQVDDASNISTDWEKDATATYSENCNELIVDCQNVQDSQLTCIADLPSENVSLPTVTNSVGNVTISVETVTSNNSGCVGDPIIITRTYTINDEGGNSEECIQTFTVESINEPTINTTLTTYTEELDANCEYQLPDYTALATSTADCGTATITQSPAAGTIISEAKDTEITLTATDSCGRTAKISINLTTIINTELIALAKNSTIQLDASGVANITASQIDNGSNVSCSVVSLTIDTTTFNCSNIGENTVTLTATDTNGNSATATAVVTVEDTIAPTVITQNINVELNENGTSSIVASDIDNGSSDNCEIASITLDKTEFDCTSVGENIVTLTVTDIHGNSSSKTATVNVIDKIKPTAIAQNITAQLDATGIASITADQVDNGSTVNCGTISLAIDTTTFNCTNIGENTVTLTVTDTSGNSTTATAIVTVEDTIAPTVITQNINVELNENGTSSIVASDIDNGSSDNCEIASITLDKTEFDCTSTGENTVTLTVTDTSGNSATATAIVTIEDTTAPTAIAQNITAQLDATGIASITADQVNNGSTANCGTISLAIDTTTFNCTNIGENTVTLTVTDTSGNSATATAIVTVEDTIVPTVITQNINVELNENGTSNIVVSDIDNGSSDNCEIASITLDKTEFDCTSVGENTVTLTVTDIHGNSNSKTATVMVSESIVPVANCIAPFTLALDKTGNATITASQLDNGSTDNCGIASISIDKESFDCSNIGENTVTLTVTDTSGNKSTCTTIVTIVDTTPPIVITKNTSIELDSNGNANITAEDIDDGSFDACGIASISLDQTTFNCPSLTEHTITLTVTDNYGNSASEIALVTFTSSDLDNDTIADICDTDLDGDGVDNDIDNCPTIANSDQADLDRNGIGDVCDQSDLKIAKGFSPNGDGVNDEFIIEGLHNFPNNSIQIYNRYGNIVYESSNYQNYWDGVSSGKNEKLPAAPYYYVLSINGGTKIVKGWIYINY